MIVTATATRAERWDASCVFEFEPSHAKCDVTSAKSGAHGRGRRHFASASVALSEGVMSKPSASYSPPPPKPKVRTTLWDAPLYSVVI